MLKLSVIIPIYKVEKFLNQCIDSLLSQTYSNLEIILVNDGSPDRCLEICKKYATMDSRVIVIDKANGGSSDARNWGIVNSSGDYIVFVDSDDWLCEEDALEKVVQMLSKTNSDLLIWGYKKFSMDSHKYYGTRKMSTALTRCVDFTRLVKDGIWGACAWDKIVRRDIIIDNNLSFVKGQSCEDIEWSIKLLLYCKTVDVLNIAPYVYRQNPNSVSAGKNIKSKNIEDMLSVIEKYSVSAYLSYPYIVNFLALELVLVIVASVFVGTSELLPFKSRFDRLFFLFKYDAHHRVKIAKKIKFLGIYGMRIIFKSYMMIKK